MSDEELEEESEESHHQGSGDEGTCTELPPLPTKQADQEADTNKADAVNKSSDNGLVGNEDTEDNESSMTASLLLEGSKDENKATPSPESCKDENKEIKDENGTETSDSVSDKKSSLDNTATPTLETFEVT